MVEDPQVVMGSTKSSAIGSPEGGALDASPVEDSTQGRLELAFNWAALCLSKMAPIGAMIRIGSNARKSTKPKSNRILWMKTGKNKPWDLALLLWTSIRERMKNVGKMIWEHTRAHISQWEWYVCEK